MTPIARRLAALEARRPRNPGRVFVVYPWDLLPDATDDDMVLQVQFVRPTDQFGGERVPYERTGILPGVDDPASNNGRLYQESHRAGH